MSRGLFITFEGGEGTGKSTQIAALRDRLFALGIPVRATREPGGTPVGDRVRDILLDPALLGMDPWAEVFLYEASRAAHVAGVVSPALERGETVLCDRYGDSTLAYQGYGRELDLVALRMLNDRATGGLVPDLTVVLDTDAATGLSRATRHGADRLESEEIDFHEAVRTGFLALAATEPERFVVIDVSGAPGDIVDSVWSALSARPVFAALLAGGRA
jgi:dTMP kinase